MKTFLALILATATAQARSTPEAGRRIVAGVERQEAGDLNGAIGNFERATRADTRSASAFFHLGDAYFRRAFAVSPADKQDLEAAVEAYETALAVDPKLAVLRDPFLLFHGLAQCQEALGDYNGALESIKRASSIARRNPMPHLYGARVRYKMKDFDKSQANLYYSVRRAREAKMYPQLAKMVKENAMFQDLMTLPQNKLIIDVYDSVQDGTLTEAEAKERIRGFTPYRDALSDTDAPSRSPQFSKPTERADPRDPEVRKFVEEGNRAFEHGRYRQAVSAYQDALGADSRRGTLDEVNKSHVLEKIGESYRKMGLASEAVRVLRHAVSTMPNNSGAHYQLALCYAMEGELGNSLSSLNKALDTASTVPQMRQTLLLARTDAELEGLRELPKYQEIIKSHSVKFSAMR